MADFQKAFEFMIVNEGGYTDNPYDHGGETNLGVTHKEWAAYLGRPVSSDEMKNLTREDVAPLYKKNYWDTVSGDKINHDGMATCIFDIGVNFGPSRGAKFAQTVCNQLGASLVVDGAIGPLSLQALNLCDHNAFIQKFSDLVVQRYESIIANDPSQKVFEKGWLNRAHRLLTLKS